MTDKQFIEQAKQIITEKSGIEAGNIIDFLATANLLNVKNIRIALIRKYYHDILNKNGYKGMEAIEDAAIHFDIPERYVHYCVYQYLHCAI